MQKIIFLMIAFLLLMPFIGIQAEEEKTAQTIDVYIFTQTGCQYCAKAKELLETLQETEYPEIKVHEFDMKANPKYVKKFDEFNTAYDISPSGVPVTFIGNKSVQGWKENELRQLIEFYHLPTNEYPNPQQIVDDFLKENPDKAPADAPRSPKETLGWVVLGVIVVGGGIFIINKAF
ncbi:hypothetical protein HQ571_02535 [Candidatus Kuenenbacteria bacterium]|nr:hypothetical protein [Candidatus Kuenenbacteria bacterium]